MGNRPGRWKSKGDLWWQPARSKHQTAPPSNEPVVYRPREPAPAVEENRDRFKLVLATGPYQHEEVPYSGVESAAVSEDASRLYDM